MSEAKVGPQLRRRQAAAARCEPLEDGRTDPISKPKRQMVVEVRVVGKYSVEFVGPLVLEGIRKLGLRYQRHPQGGSWLVQQQHSDDLMAWLEHRGVRIDVTL